MKKKTYTSAPLPFQGQKRNFITKFKEALKDYPPDAVYVDLFGGSGLLSHTVKSVHPDAKVVYNDFDNFTRRLKSVKTTNKLLDELRAVIPECKKGTKMSETVKKEVIAIIENYERKYGFVDYITISSSLLFSANFVDNLIDLKSSPFYNKLRKSDYIIDGYLNGVEVVNNDYKAIYYKYKDCRNVVFLIDPPYLSTDISTYNSKYWKLKDYLDVLILLKDTNYFYFTSNKSNMIELCEWIENNTNSPNPFGKPKIVYRYNPVSNKSNYSDIMLHRRWTTDTTF